MSAASCSPPSHATLQELFATRFGTSASRSSAAFFVSWSEDTKPQTLTFAQFGSHIDAAMSALELAGVQQGERVGVLSHNSLEYWAFCCAAICLGAVPVMLNYRQPTSFYASMVETARCTRLLASPAFKDAAIELLRECGDLRGPVLLMMPCLAHESQPEDSPAAPEQAQAGAQLASVSARPEAATGSGGSYRFEAPSQGVPTDVCLVFFTTGSTSAPKAVPHMHKAVLAARDAETAFYRREGIFLPEASEEDCMLTFGPGYHIWGFLMTFLTCVYAGVRFVDDADAARRGVSTRPLGAQVLCRAAAEVRPSLWWSVPIILEQLAAALEQGTLEVDPAAVARPHALMWGGGPMPEETAKRLHRHGVKTIVSYGQTETAGLVLVGLVGNDEAPAATRPICDAYQAQLIDAETNQSVEGVGTELPLHIVGCPSIFVGYEGKPPRPDQNRHITGDIFEEVHVASYQGRLLRHVCRDDDVLNHTSGEMTNPLPAEQALMRMSAGIMQCCVMCGNKRPRAMLLLELCKGMDAADPQTLKKIGDALKKATAKLPIYSRVHPHHVAILPAGSLPVTFKGAVQRAKAEKAFCKTLDAMMTGQIDGLGIKLLASPPPPATESGGDDEDADGSGYDSLAFTGGGKGKGGGSTERQYEFLTGARFLACLWVVAVHHTLPATEQGVKNLLELARKQEPERQADGAMRRAGVAMCFFMMARAGPPSPKPHLRRRPPQALTSGFGVHLTFWKTPIIAKGWPSLLKFLLERMDRLVLTLWLGFTLSLVLKPWANPAENEWSRAYFGEYIFCCVTGNIWSAIFPDSELCLGAGWFIGALIPLTLLYPLLVQTVIRCVDRAAGSYGLAALALFLYALYFAPALAVTIMRANDDKLEPYESGVLGFRGLQRFVGFHAPDFFVGCVTAHISLKHAQSVKDAAAEPSDQTLLPLWRAERRRKWCVVLSRGALADMCIVFVFFWAFKIFTSCKSSVSSPACLEANTQVLLDSHASVPVFALFLYGASAKGGSGLAARLMAHPGLVAFGVYSLDAYLLSAPLGTLCIGLGFQMQGMNFVTIEGFFMYMLLLWLLSGMNAELLMAPLTSRLRRCLGGEGASGCSCGSRRSSGGEIAPKKGT